MPDAEAASEEQQKRNSIRLALERAGVSVDDGRLDTLARAVDMAQMAGDAISRLVPGERPPAVFRAPEPRDD
jgi:hypothetical protein